MAPGSMNAEPPVPAVRDRRGLAKKLHSLSGVVPLGAYLVLHLWMTSSLVGSRDVYDRQVGFIHSGVLGILEPLIIAPLFFHAIYGLTRVLGPRAPDHAYDTNALLMLQRVSGVVVLVFLGLHLWEFRAQTWMRGLGESAYSTRLVLDLSSTTYSVPLIALGYIVGTAACVFHLANGMTSFCATWGLTQTEAAKARARITFRIAGVLLFALSAAMVIQLATGTRLFPATKSALGPTECGPDTPPVEAPSHALPTQKAPRNAPPAPSASPTTVPSGSAPLPTGGH